MFNAQQFLDDQYKALNGLEVRLTKVGNLIISHPKYGGRTSPYLTSCPINFKTESSQHDLTPVSYDYIFVDAESQRGGAINGHPHARKMIESDYFLVH